ncbi:colicin V production protein [Tamaricihabitans halophyticus]|uniref:Colicin V production protein n=1 Tax=Tamaricihabitans halophyticus TaxID=1262583 RepID=A0A4R2R4D6_9PSEU|nr:MarP family serine protease [Tamaricihabitans halophyticus]TCP56867.1 colicin V production protein [Tamaricihabitans halophyticus]
MNWVDILVIVLALLAAISGARQGFVVALPAFVGVLIGAIGGIRLAPLIVENFDHPAAKVGFAVAIVVLLVAIGEMLGVYLGRKLKKKITSRKIDGVDSVFGAVVQGFVVFVVAWLIAMPLTSATGMPGLVSAVKGSTVLGAVDKLIPPGAQEFPGELRALLDASGFPAAIDPFSRTPITEVGPPDAGLQNSEVVQRVQSSVLKVQGRAPACSRSLEGSSVVVAPERVMTNAHVVAGTTDVTVDMAGERLPAYVVHFDPNADIAMLAVPGLPARPLPIASPEAVAGDDAIVLGYPLDGPYTASPARVRQRIQLQGPDIYGDNSVPRDVYTVRALVRSGNSGGPMVDPGGSITGLVFGAATDDPETGFVLTTSEIGDEVRAAPRMTQEVGTGPCTSG